MKKLDIKLLHDDVKSYVDKEVVVAGWVKSCRGNGSFGFIDLNDGTSFKGVQIVFNKDKIKNFEIVEKLNTGSAIMCTGSVVLTPENKQPFEIQANGVTVISATDKIGRASCRERVFRVV